MSCSSHSCSSCSAGHSSSSDQNEISSFPDPDVNKITIEDINKTIEYGIKLWNEDNHKRNPTFWDDHLNRTGKMLSKNNASNMKPLLIILENLGPNRYYRICKKFLELDITGHKISWAWQYAKEDLKQFCNLIDKEEEDLLNYVNEQNELYYIINPTKQNERVKPIKANNLKLRESEYGSTIIHFIIVFIIVFSVVNLVKVYFLP